MPSPQRPTVRARRIGNALRELRDERGLTVRAVVRRIQRSTGWLSSIENGLQPIHLDDLNALLDFYEVKAGPLRDSLLDLATQGRRSTWTRALEGRISAVALDLASIEGSCSRISSFQPNVIPGLLQSEDYTRGLIAADLPDPTRDIEELIAFRQSRQVVLFKPNPVHYVPIVGEAALRRPLGGAAVFKSQLDQMVAVSSRDNVDLRVLPLTANVLVPEAFTILRLRPPGQLTVTLLDQVMRSSFIEDEEQVRQHMAVFDHLLGAVLEKTASLHFIHQIASEL